MSGTFEALVLVGLAVLIAVVIALAVFVMRRSRRRWPADGDWRTVPPRFLGDDRRPAIHGRAVGDCRARGAAGRGRGKAFARREAAEAEVVELQTRAEDLMRTRRRLPEREAEEEAATAATSCASSGSDLERREQRLADREERLDAEAARWTSGPTSWTT